MQVDFEWSEAVPELCALKRHGVGAIELAERDDQIAALPSPGAIPGEPQWMSPVDGTLRPGAVDEFIVHPLLRVLDDSLLEKPFLIVGEFEAHGGRFQDEVPGTLRRPPSVDPRSRAKRRKVTPTSGWRPISD